MKISDNINFSNPRTCVKISSFEAAKRKKKIKHKIFIVSTPNEPLNYKTNHDKYRLHLALNVLLRLSDAI